LWQPTSAIELLAAEAAGPTAADTAVPDLLSQELWLARAYGELFEIGPAQECFDRAESLIRPDDSANQARINAARARLELDATGDLARAAHYLEPTFDLPPTDPGSITLQLTRAVLADRRGHSADVGQILTQLTELLGGSPLAGGLVRVALAGLAASSAGWADQRPAYLDLLADRLAGVEPAARLAMLASLGPCRPVVGRRQTAGRLRALIVGKGQRDVGAPSHATRSHGIPASAESLDQAWRDLVTVQVLRVTGMLTGEESSLRDRGLAALRDDSFIEWYLLTADAAADRAAAVPGSPELFKTQYGRYPLLTAAFLTEWVDQYGDTVPYRADRWLTTAEGLLAASGTRRTARHARLFEVQARRAEAHRDSARAQELNDAAREVWAALRDPREAPPNGGHGANGVVPTAEPIRELTLDAPEPGRTSQAGASPRGRGATLHVPANIADAGLGAAAGVLPWGRVVGEELATSLGALLADAAIPQSVDVRIRFPAGRTGDVPWELVDVDGKPLVAHRSARFVWRGPDDADQQRHEVLYLQRALAALGIDAGGVDGVAGPAYRQGLAEFQDLIRPGLHRVPGRSIWWSLRARLQAHAARQRPAQLRVHILQPMTGGSLGTLRNFEKRIGSLAHSYREAYAAARGRRSPQLVLQRTSNDIELSRLLHGARPESAVDVLHVCTVMEASAQMPVLGLVSGPPLTVTALDEIVQKLTRITPPLVVLDVLALTRLADTRQQLLMRNRFAQQLLELGSTGTIIATGLARPQDTAAQWTAIASALAEQCTPAEICRRIQLLPTADNRGSTSDREAHAVGCTATALFSGIRPEAMIEPGLLGQ